MKEKVLIVEDEFIEANYLRSMLERAGYNVCGIARSVPAALEIIKKEKPVLVLLDIFLSGKLTGIDLAIQLREDNIAFIYLSANSNEEILTAAKVTQPYGFLVKPFREKDLLITLEIARYRHEHSVETMLRQETLQQKQLVNIMEEPIAWEQKLLRTAKAMQPCIPFEYMAVGPDIGFLRIGFDEYQVIRSDELMIITNLKMHELAALRASTPAATTAACYNGAAFKKSCQHPSINKLVADHFEMRSHLVAPLHLSTGEIAYFFFYSRRPDAYNAEHLATFSRWQLSLAKVMAHMPPAEKAFPAQTLQQVHQPPEAPTGTAGFEGIIGNSHLLLNVFDQIMQVAPSASSVLILGESGTGKERIADCIHRLSPRREQPFIKVNCAALPATLIESELFGHEKGAFTGATDKRTGKFEQADGGTIFLDEIGEMPIELQVKLLRVLQEKEIERIGCKAPTKINIRVIAATSRVLEKEVAEGRFRLDLYYRLNVFPIQLPPLRERKEDIPALTAHFINYYNRKTGKKIAGLSDKVMKQLMGYSWPGNVRELEHLIERSVLLAKGATIENITLPVLKGKELPAAAIEEDGYMKTIHENERDHIIAVLKKCNGKIWGPGAAAEVLNIPPSTLKSKMKKLGIKKTYIV